MNLNFNNMKKDFRKYFKSRHPFMMTVLDDYVKKTKAGVLTPYITREPGENGAG